MSRPGDKSVSSIVAVWEVVSERGAAGWDSSISSSLLSEAAAARELLSRAKRLRRLDLDDWRFTGL